jgi:hypothetical protein
MAERFSSAEGAFNMLHHAISIRVLAAACGLLASASVAQAAPETWVSGTGTDAGNCPRTAPCRTFAFAHDQTNNNGAINVLTAGNFGPLSITKPISIVADGVEAVINTAAGGGAVISLRGLTIDMRGTANIGIHFVSGGALHVQNCVIRKADTGIEFNPGSGTPELYVADSVVANAASTGISVHPVGNAGAKAMLERVRAENGADVGILITGFPTTGSISATVRDSVSAGNGGPGIFVSEGVPGTTTVMIDRSAAVNNLTGIFATGEAVVLIGDSTGDRKWHRIGHRPERCDYFLLDQRGERQRHRRLADQHDPDEID